LGYFVPDINHDDWTLAEDLTLIEKHNEFGNNGHESENSYRAIRPSWSRIGGNGFVVAIFRIIQSNLRVLFVLIG
jgi:hypothetical protein